MSIGTGRSRAVAAAGALAIGLSVAACGSSSSASSGTTAPASSGAGGSAGASAAASAGGTPIGTTSGSAGTYLTGASGRALYLWVADSHGKSNCSGACASAWPPLLTRGTPVASGGVTSSELGTITRSGGAEQVTYDGHPLYYYAGDPKAGTTNGQGSDGFGAKWWLVAPSGSAISSGSSAGSGSSSSGGSSSSSW
jgi:predicted lipoprotein with Yx(FWY)xxD motif